MTNSSRAAFTLIELLVAMVISSILITATTSVYTLFRKSVTADQAKADITQNGRIAMDRISRELRQTSDIVTDLPQDPADTSVIQPSGIEFLNGHAVVGDSNYLTYNKYYISGGVLKLDVKEYYFASFPNTRVVWNTVGSGGSAPVAHVISTQDVADRVTGIHLYDDNNVITMVLTTGDGQRQTSTLRTAIVGRNL